jgi:SAM-dependent methyltransferase
MLSAVLNQAECRVLRWISPGEPNVCTGAAYAGKSKLAVLLGNEFLGRARGKTVVDFGCGEGAEAIELARSGAKRVIGIDIREDVLEKARRDAMAARVERICEFVTETRTPADVILSLDSFEHFADPSGILRVMDRLLLPGGEVIASFGPTWYHPLGGHLFSVFPWAHVVFSETALMCWRAEFKTDGATSFQDAPGGLNRMTIRRFERTVADSPFRFAEMQTVPIRKMRWLHNRWTREFTTALVRCRLVRR